MTRKDHAEDDLQRLRVAWLSRAPGDRFRLGGEAFVGLPGPILRQALRLVSQNQRGMSAIGGSGAAEASYGATQRKEIIALRNKTLVQRFFLFFLRPSPRVRRFLKSTWHRTHVNQ